MNRVRFAPFYVRKAVYKRVAGQCQYCGSVVSFQDCNMDHVVPQHIGGTTRKKNLVVACQNCNRLKGTQLIPEELRPRKGELVPFVKYGRPKTPARELQSQGMKDKISVF